MTRRKSSELESQALGLFPPGETFTHNNEQYTVVCSGKPKPSKGGGEPKTDVYIRADNQHGNSVEWCVSIKGDNADFVENKLGVERAQSIMGDEWARIVTTNLNTLYPLLNTEKYYPVVHKDRGTTLRMGYRLDVTLKETGELCVPVELPQEAVREIYSGAKLPEKKKNSIVNGVEVKSSGVSTHIIHLREGEKPPSTAEEFITRLSTVEEYVTGNPTVWLKLSAVNMRSPTKYDSARPLVIRYDYHLDEHGELFFGLNFTDPLVMTSSVYGKTISRDILDSVFP